MDMRLPISATILIVVCLLHPPSSGQSEVIEANNSRSPVDITSSDIISITISYQANASAENHDWWIAATTSLAEPNHLFYFDGDSWSTNFSVAFQQPLTEIESLEVLAGSGLPAGSYAFYFGTDRPANGELDVGTLSYDSITVVSETSVARSEQSCGNSKQLFDTDPLENDAYFQIDPLGATNPSAHTFPTVHTYMMLADNTVSRNVFAPGDIMITQINVVENLTAGGTDYSLNFTPCPEVTGYFDHLSNLNQQLLDTLSDFDSCQQYIAGTDEYRFCSKFVSVEINSGAILGTAGGGSGQLSAALDFGLRDTRSTALVYANLERLGNSDQLYVVCPYDYYVPGTVKAGLVSKLGNAREDLPVCGTVGLDIPGTAQGRWYLKDSIDFGENDHMALVPSNKQPATTGVISAGNTDLGTDAYFFDFETEGSINQAFNDVSADLTIYCWDNLRNRAATLASGNAQSISGIIFLRMTDSDNLIAQRSTQQTLCPSDTSTLSFDGAAIEFER